MKLELSFLTILVPALMPLCSVNAEPIFHGDLRAYNVRHWYREADDTRATSLGGNFSLTSPDWNFLSAAGTLSVANNLGLEPKKVSERVSLLPSDNVTVLSEAYFKWEQGGFRARGGALKIETPFANSADAFMIPVTFKGLSFDWKPSAHLDFTSALISEVKSRESNEFVNTGEYLLGRYGKPMAPRNMAIAGTHFNQDTYKGQAFLYLLDDSMLLSYLDLFYTLPLENEKFYIGLQGGKERSVGDHFLGEVNSQVLGAKFGGVFMGNDLSLALSQVDDTSAAFKHGAWLEPFSFFTSAVFTNSMMSGVGNKYPGTVSKLTWTKSIDESWNSKISYSDLQFKNVNHLSDGVWQKEWDFDLGYKCSGGLKGLSLLNRLAYLDGGQKVDQLYAWRFQTMYQF